MNAFALPGGYIYVNRGVIERADKMDELAGVMGHEIGHVVKRHSVKQMQTQQGANIGIALTCVLTHVCDSDASQAAIQVGGAAVFAKFSRQDEQEADEEGFKNVIRAGISPKGLVSFFQKLMAEEKGGGSPVDAWFSDHPLTQDRIADIQKLDRREGSGDPQDAHRGHEGLSRVQGSGARAASGPEAEGSDALAVSARGSRCRRRASRSCRRRCARGSEGRCAGSACRACSTGEAATGTLVRFCQFAPPSFDHCTSVRAALSSVGVRAGDARRDLGDRDHVGEIAFRGDDRRGVGLGPSVGARCSGEAQARDHGLGGGEDSPAHVRSDDRAHRRHSMVTTRVRRWK